MKKKIKDSKDKKKPKAFFGLPKICKFCRDKIESIDYKEINKLRMMTTEKGKIIPRRISGNCAKHQRKLTSAIKRSRNVGFLPFTL